MRELENHKDGTMLAGRVGFRLALHRRLLLSVYSKAEQQQQAECSAALQQAASLSNAAKKWCNYKVCCTPAGRSYSALSHSLQSGGGSTYWPTLGLTGSNF